MRYRLTFTVNDKSEDADFVEKHFFDKPSIKMDYVVAWGCDIAKDLDFSHGHRTYSLYYAEILED